MINYTDIDDDDLTAYSPFDADLSDAELVAYWEEKGSAAHITNADPTWYDASSIQEAVEKAQDQDYE